MLVGDMIRLNALYRGRAEALVLVGGRRLTYSELEDEIRRVRAALRGSGVRKGDRVAVLAKNSLEYFLLYFAAASTGAIVVPLNFWHRPREHEYTIGNCEPTLLFVEEELWTPSLGVLPAGTRMLQLPTGEGNGG